MVRINYEFGLQPRAVLKTSGTVYLYIWTSHWVNDNIIILMRQHTEHYVPTIAILELETWNERNLKLNAWLENEVHFRIRKRVSRIHSIKANNSWQEVQDASQESQITAK